MLSPRKAALSLRLSLVEELRALRKLGNDRRTASLTLLRNKAARSCTIEDDPQHKRSFSARPLPA